MFVELAGIGGCVWLLQRIMNQGKRELKENFKMSMQYKGLQNKNKANPKSPELLKVIQKQYGYDAIISIPYGMDFEQIKEAIPIIEANLRCRCSMEWVREKGCIYARFVTVPIADGEPFTPVKTEPYQMYCGTTYYRENVIVDMRKHPNVLITGAVGSGKSFMIFLSICNMIHNHTDKEVELYLSQISTKQDLKKFKDCKQVKSYADNIEDACAMFEYLIAEMTRRNNLIYAQKDCDTISDLNKSLPEDKKLPFIYTFSDEFSFYMDDGTESPYEATLKARCRANLVNLIKQGRSAGIFVVVGLQRPDKENIPPIFKSMLCTRIAFLQNNTASSLVVIDSGDAVNLKQREAIVRYGGENFLIKTPFLSSKMIQNYIKPNLNEKEHYIDLKTFKPKKKGNNQNHNVEQQESKSANNESTPKKNKNPNKKGVIGGVGSKG
jgi:S-DNA-T family DNA segregation ATPase FtsK/SpoIIIE